MGGLSPITEAEVVPLHGANGPGLDEVGLAAWIAQAEPGEALVYHRGFLAVGGCRRWPRRRPEWP